MKILFLILALTVATASYALEPIKDEVHQVLFKVDGDFNDVKENVGLAIENQGLVINYTATVGDMLERTGNDLGLTDHTYMAADVIEFCSAALTRKMVAADPSNLVFCPYGIHLYELRKEPGVIYVGYKRPQLVGNDESKAALESIEELLSTIVNEALAW
ncbi:MAG: hypothetical protein DHS20C01_19860 [marine bacterium B5-7]|nr:MAG: hypothetical protein DHS20C01_19860 [marine bacterium B5-7]